MSLLTVVYTDTKLCNSTGIRENSGRKWGVAPEDKRVVDTYPAGRSVRKDEAIEGRVREGALPMSDASKRLYGQLPHNTRVLFYLMSQLCRSRKKDHSQENPRNIQGEEAGVGGSLLLQEPKSMVAHRTLPGRQKEKTVLGWSRSQSLSQQQFKSQVPGVKSQMQIGKAVSAS